MSYVLSCEADAWSSDELADRLWPEMEYTDGPVNEIAGLEDSSQLRKLIDRCADFSDDDYYYLVIDQPHDFKFLTPLLRAIDQQRYENVYLLLAQGANPDGVSYHLQTSAACRYRRFCFIGPVHLFELELGAVKEEVGTVQSQIDPPHLTHGELQERHEDELYPSQLCISTPVHLAIATKNRGMLQKLFDVGVSPNARALITGSQALTPAQLAIMLGDLEAYAILLSNGADASITTPVFGAHALHFAAAQLRIDLLQAVSHGHRQNAPVTSMGHTLLHIACLPFDRHQIQTSAPKIVQSIHDFRRTTSTFTRSRDTAPRDLETDNVQQEAVCRFIAGTYGSNAQVTASDKHGNNMLHYLASSRCLNTSLIEWAKQQEGGLHAWDSKKNFWGFTPLDLYEEGEAARAGRLEKPPLSRWDDYDILFGMYGCLIPASYTHPAIDGLPPHEQSPVRL